MLQIHRSARADLLVGALADVLSTPLADPMAPEVVSVHSRGIERWITQELSARLGAGAGRRDGICANVRFPFPSRVVGEALSAAVDLGLEDDPWSPERLVWPVLETLEERIGEDWLAPVARHLGRDQDRADDSRRGRRFGTARRIADLFDRYAIHRPDMIRAWAADEDVDGRLEPVTAEHRWQPRLWRTVRGRLDVESTAERLAHAVETLRAGEVDTGLPPRFSVFGLTAVPGTYVQILSALATHRDVHLFLLHPSPALWERVSDVLRRGPEGVLGPRDTDPTRSAARHPILASWGRDAREMQAVVATVAEPDRDDHRAVEAAPRTLLARLQEDVRRDTEPPGPPAPGADDARPVLAPDDRSVQVHACHGRTRQVEVLRDAVLHLLAEHDDLEPRDIVVMCPRIEEFAPLIEAVFGAEVEPDDAPTGVGDGPPDLRVRLADRALLQTNPVLRVAAQLLELADSRVTASDVLDIVNRTPVRRRFRFDDEAVQRLEDWVEQLGVRWGLDAEHRADHGLEGIEANTWRAGLERLLLGVAIADEDLRTVGGTVPFDDVEGSDVELAGRFAELLDRLDQAVERLTAAQPIDAWRDALIDAVDAVADVGDRDVWQRHQLARVLGDVVDEATDGDHVYATRLTLPEVRTLLDRRLQGRPSRASHRTGDLTVCTLVPMRSVPHRVLCLLGMDDEAFPRRTVPDGDDLIDLDPRVGDRDPRTEDRQLLLDALLAARDHLVVTYTGRDERTNESRAPAVPIGELLDVIDRTVRTGDPDDDGAFRPARTAVLTAHPLQPFDARNFIPEALGVDGPWSFDPTDLAGARALTSEREARTAFLPGPLDPDDTGLVALDDLVAFLQHPVKAFLNQRLQVFLPSHAETSSDGIPVELGGLEAWQIGERLLAARLAGHDPDRWAEVERARGTLPPGDLADAELDEIRHTVDVMFEAAAELGCGEPARRTLEVDLQVGGRDLVGNITGVVDDTLVTLTYSRLAPKHRIAAWARLAAVTTTDPDRPWRAVTIGRESSNRASTARYSVQGPLGQDPEERRDTAGRLLEQLVDLYDRGLREPLPLYCDTSAAIARAVADGKSVWKANHRWETTWRYPKDDRDPHHVLVLGRDVTFEELLDAAARDDECGPDWYEDHDDEDSRLVRYALRLWAPLLGIGRDAPLETTDSR